MRQKQNFIKASKEFNDIEKHVPAYYFRRKFSSVACRAKLSIAVCGFYELYFNGSRITRGFLSPYVSNTNDYVYYDEYDVTLEEGENVVAIHLGNGLQNNPGGYIWDFDKAPFRSAPMFALEIVGCDSENDIILLESDTNFKIAESPIRSDDYRFGEYYDANYEIDGWYLADFDDSLWNFALSAESPKGELRIADVSPIIKEREITPVEIFPCGGGFIYDFGESNAGICRLKIKAEQGRKIELRHADSMKDGDLNIRQIWFKRDYWERDRHIVHLDTYVCKGDGIETYEPTFTYHGFRYVRVDGITEAEATPDLLTYLVYHTDLHTRGGFTCSDPMAEKIQEITKRSIVSNFHHVPTDCPQREKNGWTADAALSCEAALLNFDPERNYREWMRNIRKAQAADGSLPGIIPTGGWGFEWGNGPAWDCVLAQLPYFVYVYRGETEMITDSAESFIKYLSYLETRRDEKGLLSIGLGDWAHVGGIIAKAPLIVTDSIITMDTASKMAEMLEVVGMSEYAEYARGEAEKYRNAIRANLVDYGTMTVSGACQSSQAMGIYYGVFEENEIPAAFENLLRFIHEQDDHIDLGVLGGRVIFHVLTKYGYSDLAYKMITREDYPSYGNWIKRGATTLWEDFRPDTVASMNHHFWGDVSAWFIKCIAGIRLNPAKHNVNSLEIRPSFITALESASAYHEAPAGRIDVSWERSGGKIVLNVKIPEAISATAELDEGYVFEDGNRAAAITSGSYTVTKID